MDYGLIWASCQLLAVWRSSRPYDFSGSNCGSQSNPRTYGAAESGLWLVFPSYLSSFCRTKGRS